MSDSSPPGVLSSAPHPARPLATTQRDRHRLRRVGSVRRALAVSDLLGLLVAFLVSIRIYGSHASNTNEFGVSAELALFAATLPGWLLLAKLHGLYDRDERHAGHSTVDEVIPVVVLVTVGSWLLYAVSGLTRFAEPYPPKLLTFWLLAVVLVVAGRIATRALLRRRSDYTQAMVVVGAGETAQLIARKLEHHPEYGVRLLGFVDTVVDANGDELVLGSPEELPQIVRDLGVERVLIAFPNVPVEAATSLVRELRQLAVQVDVVPRFVDLVTPGATIYAVEGFPLISLEPVRHDPLLQLLKRALDVAGAVIWLLLLAPALCWIALRIKLDSPGAIFYRHERIGLRGRPFRLLKFRTMYDAASDETKESELLRLLEDPALRAEYERTHKFANDPRTTPFGRFLRRLSLDELPQLVNVLSGDMSLVGPRPITVDELSRYGDDAATLLSVRPGVTGYWQVNGRSRTDYDDRVRLDLAYVRGWSLKLDFLILGKTAWVLVTGHGAY